MAPEYLPCLLLELLRVTSNFLHHGKAALTSMTVVRQCRRPNYLAQMAARQDAVDSGHRRESETLPHFMSSERQPLLGPSDEEENRPHDSPSPVCEDEQIETKHASQWQHENTFKLLAVVFDFFFMGVYQTAVGALIPEIERFYHHGDGATASIFVVFMAGYLCATAAIQHIHLRFGRRGIAILSPSIRLLAAVLLSTGPSFHVALGCYVLFGFGTGLVDAGWLAWASSLPYANICQGVMGGAFSTGCVVGPIAALAVVKKGFEWYEFYRFAVSIPTLFSRHRTMLTLSHEGGPLMPGNRGPRFRFPP